MLVSIMSGVLLRRRFSLALLQSYDCMTILFCSKINVHWVLHFMFCFVFGNTTPSLDCMTILPCFNNEFRKMSFTLFRVFFKNEFYSSCFVLRVYFKNEFYSSLIFYLFFLKKNSWNIFEIKESGVKFHPHFLKKNYQIYLCIYTTLKFHSRNFTQEMIMGLKMLSEFFLKSPLNSRITWYFIRISVICSLMLSCIYIY